MDAIDAQRTRAHALPGIGANDSSALARILGAAAGFLVAVVPVAIENAGDPLGGVRFGMESLFSHGLVVGPVLGAIFGPGVRRERLRIGLLLRMAVVAVLLGDALIVGFGMLSADGVGEVLVGGLALYLLGLMFLGVPILLVTIACAAAWQGVMIVALRLIGPAR